MKSFIGLLFLEGASVVVTLFRFIEVVAEVVMADIFCDDVDWVHIEDGVTDSVGVNVVLCTDTPVEVKEDIFFVKLK